MELRRTRRKRRLGTMDPLLPGGRIAEDVLGGVVVIGVDNPGIAGKVRSAAAECLADLACC